MIAGLALAAGVGGGATLAGQVAVGQTSPSSTPIVLSHSGSLFDRGVGVKVKVTVACGAGDQGSVIVSLNERSGRSIASGTGYNNFNCTGQIETMTVAVLAGSGGPFPSSSAPFVKGTAFGQASLQDCNPNNFQCTFGDTSHNVKVTK